MLDHPIGKRARIILVIALCSLPTAFVARQFDSEHGFTRMLNFGWSFFQNALPQVRALSPGCISRLGTDGQFYAQVAIDPSLRDPNLAAALDNPEYRARRILLPFLAWCIGFGQPAAVLTAYAVLNLLFWYLLFALLVRSQQPVTVRDWLCLIAILWTSGVLISISRAFTDLPAATLLVLAAITSQRFKSVAMALAILTKETYALCAWPVLVEGEPEHRGWWKTLGRFTLMLGPIVVWMFYAHWRFHGHPQQSGDFSWPMAGWLYAIVGKVWTGHFDQAIAAAALFVQLVYLVIHRRYDSFFWRVGITFGLAAMFLGREPFTNQTSFTRDLLPLTIAFNVLLTKDARYFTPWFLAGNGGLFIGVAKMIGGIISPW